MARYHAVYSTVRSNCKLSSDSVILKLRRLREDLMPMVILLKDYLWILLCFLGGHRRLCLEIVVALTFVAFLVEVSREITLS